MNKRFVFCFLVNFLLIFSLVAQNYANSQFVVFSYSYYIDEMVKEELSTLEKYINFSPVNKQNKIDALLVHSMYSIVTNIFSDSLKVFFLTPNSLSDKAKYNEYGYPDINIQRALRLSDTKYYLKIDISIENSKYDERGKKNINNEFLPLINLSIDIYNKFGYNPIQSAEGQVLASSNVVITPGFIAGMNFVSDKITQVKDGEQLKKMMEMVTLEALNNIRNKKQK